MHYARGVALPHPVANLVRLARNAKGPKDRHDSAYFAWEASVRLAVAAHPPADLEPLTMPSIGSLVSGMRASEELSADASLLATFALLSEVGLDRRASPKAIDGKTLLRALPAYRNKVIGHGSTRAAAFYEESAEVLLSGLEAAWREGFFWPDGARLAFVEEIVVDERGRRARIYDMTGLASSVEDVRGSRVDAELRPGTLYLRSDDQWIGLHPWLLRHESELRERVLFFNGRGKTSRFLDYVSGEELRGKALLAAFPDVERDVVALFHAQSGRVDDASEKSDAAVFGGYRVVGKLGEGGMGIVHLARHETMGRTVALKTLPRELSSDPTAVARFRREIAALGRCDHPNVVKVFASGEEHGTHWYAMELIDGADLAEVARSLSTTDDFQVALSTSVERMRKERASEPSAPKHEVSLGKPRARPWELARLMRDAALGLAHLHEQGIVHRDVKPANLMVTPERRLVIMDLGLASLGDATRSITKDKTSILGTLRYMAPEQLQRSLVAVDRRVDVYALGATFYELLTGRPFHDGDTEVRLVEQVLREEPPHPCKVDPRIPKDLGTIVRKATEKDPRLRYESAEAMASDLDAFLEGRPIAARPPTLGYLLGLAVRRNVPLTITIAAATAMVITGGVFFVAREARLRREADRARQQADEMRARADREKAHAEQTTLGVLEEHGRDELLSGHPLRALLYLDAAYRGGASSRALKFMLRDAMAPVDASIATLRGHQARLHCVQFSADGSKIVTASRDRTVRIWSGDDGRLLGTIASHASPVTCAQLSADGAMVASYGPDGALHVHRTTDSSAVRTFVHDQKGAVNAALFAKDGKTLFSGGDDGTVKVWDLGSDAPVKTIDVRKEVASADIAASASIPSVASLALSADGTRLAAAAQQVAIVWDVATWKTLAVLRGHREALRTVAFSPTDPSRIATAGFEERARLFRIEGDKSTAVELAGHDQSLDEAVFSHDGNRVVTTSVDGSARVFNAQSGLLEARLVGHRGEVYSAVFAPHDDLVLTASQDDTARLWEPLTGALVAVIEGHRGEVIDASFHPNGSRFVTASFDGTARLWKTSPGRRVWSSSSGAVAVAGSRFAFVRTHSVETRSFEAAATKGTVSNAEGMLADVAAISVDGTRIAAADSGLRKVWLWAGSAPPLALGARDQEIVDLSMSDGRLFVATRKTIEVWDLGKTDAPLAIAATTESLLHVRTAAKGTRILGFSRGKTATIFDDRGGRISSIACPDGTIAGAAIDRDAVRAGVACTNGQVVLADAATGTAVRVFDAHVDSADGIAFSPSGKLFVTVGRDKRANLWDAKTGTFILALEGHSGYVRDAAFTPDEAFVITASSDGTARVWDAARGKAVAVLDHGASDVHHVTVTDDGRYLVTEAADRVRIWDLSDEARTPAAIGALVQKSVPWELVAGSPVPRKL